MRISVDYKLLGNASDLNKFEESLKTQGIRFTIKNKAVYLIISIVVSEDMFVTVDELIRDLSKENNLKFIRK